MASYADYLVPQIVFLGDSLIQYSANFTNGIVPRLQNEYQRQYDVINRGFAGYNSKWISEVADPIFAGLSGNAAPIEYSVIFLGSNDAANNTLQHVDIEDYALYLENIIEVSAAYTNNTILVGPAVVNEDLWPDRSNVQFYEYSEVAKAVAADAEIPFVDLYSAFHKFFNESTALPETFTGDAPFNGSAVVYNATNDNATINATSLNETNFVPFSKRGSPGKGFIANANTTLNDTIVAVNATKYPASNQTYLGAQGNPKNALLEQVLIDGLHFNNLGYDLFYKALKPFFNASAPYYPLPLYSQINSTEYLDNYLEKSFLAAQFALQDVSTGNYSFGNYSLSNLTIGNVTYGNVSFSNFTASFPSYAGNLTDIVVDFLEVEDDDSEDDE